MIWSPEIGDWCVLEVTTLSEQQCIGFCMKEQRHLVNTGMGFKGKSSCWNTRRLCKDKFRKYLEETRLIYGLGRVKPNESLKDLVWVTRRKVVAACNHLMPRQGHRRNKGSMYW